MSECKMMRRPTPPGEILRELYLAPHEITVTTFADAAGVTRKHMSAVVNGKAAITADTAARIAEALGTTAQFWLNLQNAVDLYDASKRVQKAKRKPYRVAAFEPAYAMAAASRE
jgi:addiction module HigA family antidote